MFTILLILFCSIYLKTLGLVANKTNSTNTTKFSIHNDIYTYIMDDYPVKMIPFRSGSEPILVEI